MIQRLLLIALLWAPFLANSAENDARRHCLWRLKGETNTIHILGSVHVLRKSDYPLPEKMNAVFESAEVLVLEIDIAESANPANLKKMMLPKGKTLKNVLSKKTYRMLDKRFHEAGLPIANFAPFKPWMALETLMMSELTKLGFSPMDGLDMYFYRKALKAKKETGALESLDFQISMMDKLGSDKMVRQALRELDIMEVEMKRMVDAWKSGDLDVLAELIGEMSKGDKKIHEALFLSRNRDWVEKIQPMLESDKDYLIVVGAGHLVGEGSVIDLLEKAGHTLERL
jgi:uncharacterized protein YbaP (TraB family)